MNFPMGFPPGPFVPLPQENQTFDKAPKRVMTAVDVFLKLSSKLSKKIAVNDVGIEEISGDELKLEEEEVFVTAKNLIVKYFNGTLELTPVEKKEATRKDHGKSVVRCLFCGGAGVNGANERCDMCKGTGSLIVQPGPNCGE